jgi:peptidylprolyl isomerase
MQLNAVEAAAHVSLVSTSRQRVAPTVSAQVRSWPRSSRRSVFLLVPGVLLLSGRAAAEDGFAVGPGGLQWRDDAVGTGGVAAAGDVVTCAYVGTFTEGGGKFDAAKRFTFGVGNGEVIRGWDVTILGDAESLPPMRIGGKRTVLLPPSLAYGARGAGCR